MPAVKRYALPATRPEGRPIRATQQPEVVEEETPVPSVPTLLVLGTLDGRVMVQPSWKTEGEYDTVSPRTVEQLRRLGVRIVDEPENYLLPRGGRSIRQI